MFATVRSVTVLGVAGQPVDVEADIQVGLPGFTVIGAVNSSSRELRDRVRAAVLNSGLAWPNRRVTVNVTPGAGRFGSGLDLPVALAVLAADGQIPVAGLARVAAFGELGLDGTVRWCPGVVPRVEAVGDVDRVIGPEAARAEIEHVARRAGVEWEPVLCTTLTEAAQWATTNNTEHGTPRRNHLMSACTTTTVPAGTYIVGDPCYSVPDDRWMEWLEAADYTTSTHPVLVAELDGQVVVGVSTMYGDGCYAGSDGNEYGVDAGLIGLVPVGVAGDTPGRGPSLVEFAEPVDCYRDGDGTIHLGHIAIQTGDSDEWDDEWDDEDEDDL